MSSLLDMSLDEHIQKSKRENRRNNRKSNHSRYSNNGINDEWKHDKYDNSDSRDRRQIFSRIGNRNNNDNATLSITNLHWKVSEDELKSLFESVGEVSKVRIKYDKAGRSDGEATVVFINKSDARRAIDKYNGYDIEGMEMKIEMDYTHYTRNNNDSKKNRGSILSRLGKGKGFKSKQFNNSKNNKFNNKYSKRRGGNRETITKEMLDEEMDRYMSNEMDIEVNEDTTGNGDSGFNARNVVSYVDEDEPVKGDLNNA